MRNHRQRGCTCKVVSRSDFSKGVSCVDHQNIPLFKRCLWAMKGLPSDPDICNWNCE